MKLYEEANNTLKKISQYLPEYPEMQYFIRCIDKTFKEWEENTTPKIMVIGSSLPEEIIHACGRRTWWVLGGSTEAASSVNPFLPRDTDPVSRSSLGYILGGSKERNKDGLIIVPLVNDSSRKSAYLLESSGKQVFTIDIPPVKNKDSAREYRHQIYRCIHRLESMTRQIVTERRLKKAHRDIYDAYMQLVIFDRLADDKPQRISGICRMLIFFSYYCADSVEEWTRKLALFNQRIRSEPDKDRTDLKGNILIAGSPIYFPNYKIPLLAQESGFHIISCADYSNLKFLLKSVPDNKEKQRFGNLVGARYLADCSPAYPNNDIYVRAIYHMLSRKRVDGVVYHVLKGQIEYDFELNRLEEIFSRCKIPFIRLETDYNRQDIEQLRIRMEAFSEILLQNRRQKESQP